MWLKQLELLVGEISTINQVPIPVWFFSRTHVNFYIPSTFDLDIKWLCNFFSPIATFNT